MKVRQLLKKRAKSCLPLVMAGLRRLGAPRGCRVTFVFTDEPPPNVMGGTVVVGRLQGGQFCGVSLIVRPELPLSVPLLSFLGYCVGWVAAGDRARYA